MKNDFLFNHLHKRFTCLSPKNTFKIDYSNGYPVQITTNVTKNTKWSDIFSGNYSYANQDGIPEVLLVNGIKYIYIDAKYAAKEGYKFIEDHSVIIEEYNPDKSDNLLNKLLR